MSPQLFRQMELRVYLQALMAKAKEHVEELREDEVLERSVEDLLAEAVSLAARNGFAYCVDAPFRDLFAKFA